jgi:AraC-like DNA-binding protein
MNGCKNIFIYDNSVNLYFIRYDQIILILSPCVYLYFEKIIHDIKFFEKQDLNYFIVPLFYNYLGNEFSNDRQFDRWVKFIFILVYSLFFVYKSYKIQKKHFWHPPQNSKDSNLIVHNWSRFIFFMMLITMFHFYVYEIFYLWFEVDKRTVFLLELSFLGIFLLGYFKVIFTPELLYGSYHLKKISATKSIYALNLNKVWYRDIKCDILNDKDKLLYFKIKDKIVDYIQEIDSIAVDGKSFCNTKYSLYDLSKQMGLPKYYLDFIFKHYCQLTFNEFKKLARIYVATELIEKGYLNANKLESLAKQVGFASYNPFLVNFKEITGVSPFLFNKNREITCFKYYMKR